MQAQAGNAVQWGNVAQWVGALATTAAVIVALFKEDLIRLRRHPKLTASIEAKYPDCIKTAVQWRGANKEKPWKGWRYWLRVWVKNGGNVRAEKVEVFLSRAWVWNNSSFEPLTHFTPMNLLWSNTQDAYVDGIPPDMRRLCDLGSITVTGCYRDVTSSRLRLRAVIASQSLIAFICTLRGGGTKNPRKC